MAAEVDALMGTLEAVGAGGGEQAEEALFELAQLVADDTPGAAEARSVLCRHVGGHDGD
eukprot:SAG31_NODE_29246_length_398_cov_1.207358_1_plen_58_part_10